MCATRVGTLSVSCQTDERDAGMDYGPMANVWQGGGAAQWLRAGVRRIVSACGGRMASAGFADRYADDLESERAELEAQGIRTVARTADLCVMEAPGGQRFFVVAPSRFHTL
ncbi:hypothetical protein RD110_24145 [Rhodoferax koreense]|uniref:Uncharacterized protein n=1 Tax=Rhodoferax koreensis TaxID=1842727 RepID=A0A1P8K1M5_9BURK|nr:hypothetical protein [Rhodoferax koreense]APW39913.1 hypothetical protein RD110_24145 [Rhodoferax koreense]